MANAPAPPGTATGPAPHSTATPADNNRTQRRLKMIPTRAADHTWPEPAELQLPGIRRPAPPIRFTASDGSRHPHCATGPPVRWVPSALTRSGDDRRSGPEFNDPLAGHLSVVDRIAVLLRGESDSRVLVDQVLSLTGYAPDRRCGPTRNRISSFWARSPLAGTVSSSCEWATSKSATIAGPTFPRSESTRAVVGGRGRASARPAGSPRLRRRRSPGIGLRLAAEGRTGPSGW
jgi:hypothetical protein